MPNGFEFGVGTVVSPDTPEVSPWNPTWLPVKPVNHTLPSPRSLSSCGPSVANKVLNSVYQQPVVTRVILLSAISVNNRLPSDAPMIPRGSEATVGMAGHSVTTPAGVIFATVLPGCSVNEASCVLTPVALATTNAIGPSGSPLLSVAPL